GLGRLLLLCSAPQPAAAAARAGDRECGGAAGGAPHRPGSACGASPALSQGREGPDPGAAPPLWPPAAEQTLGDGRAAGGQAAPARPAAAPRLAPPEGRRAGGPLRRALARSTTCGSPTGCGLSAWRTAAVRRAGRRGGPPWPPRQRAPGSTW